MNIIASILAVMVLGGLLANLLHSGISGGRPGERFIYVPGSGWPRAIYIVWNIVGMALAIQFLVRFLSTSPAPFMIVFFSQGVALDIYSIYCRHVQRRETRHATPVA
jgi:hypothetical protein